MAKKGSFWDNPFGGMFDFNGDGKEDFGEQFIGFKIFEECTKDDDDDFSTDLDYDLDFTPTKDYSWRNYVELDYSTGVIPEDYETEAEYLEALNQAKYSWREYCEDGSEYGIDPEDYETEDEYNEALEEAMEDEENGSESIGISLSVECPALDKLEAIKESDFPNKRRYNAAYTLANEFLIYSDEEYQKHEKACCKFIVEEADKVIAANYLTHDNGFIYAQAVKDNFELPISLPDEDETSEYGIHEILSKIAKKDIDLSLKVWAWLIENFLPYAHYSSWAKKELTFYVFDYIRDFPDKFTPALVHYLNEHPEFCYTVIPAHEEVDGSLFEMIVVAIKEGLFDFSVVLFKLELEVAKDKWKEINKLTSGVLGFCKTWDELETIEFFQANMLPLVKAIDIGMVQDEIEGWENEIAEYVTYIEKDCEQYAYSRRFTWRKNVPDGSKYNIDPRWYDTKEEYLTALNEEKYRWRNWYVNRDTYGLDVNDFETQEEFNAAFNVKLEEKRQQQREAREQERKQRQAERYKEVTVIDDDNIYTICGVTFPHAVHPYHYRTENATLKIGDKVLVPVGDKETEGTIISVGQYKRQATPFPIDKMKFIIRKIVGEEKV